MGTEIARELLLGAITGQSGHAEAEFVGVLKRQMAEPAETLHGYQGAGGDLHSAHRVEDGDAGALDGRVLGGVQMVRERDGSFRAQDTVLRVC